MNHRGTARRLKHLEAQLKRLQPHPCRTVITSQERRLADGSAWATEYVYSCACGQGAYSMSMLRIVLKRMPPLSR
jgi:hypothetical protein